MSVEGISSTWIFVMPPVLVGASRRVCVRRDCRQLCSRSQIPWRFQIYQGEESPSQAMVQAAAASLCENGLVVLERKNFGDPLIDSSLCAECKSDAVHTLDARLSFFEKTTGANPLCVQFDFHNLGHNSPRRYDVLLDGGCWSRLAEEAGKWTAPILEAADLNGQLILHGCVMSLQGSHEQHVHRDGPDSGFVNTFIPLVDVTSQNGPTEFWLGTHLQGGSEESLSDMRSVAPELTHGSLVLFDYRLLHRGLANTSTASRPVAYFTQSVTPPPKNGDGQNFSSVKLEDAAKLQYAFIPGTDPRASSSQTMLRKQLLLSCLQNRAMASKEGTAAEAASELNRYEEEDLAA